MYGLDREVLAARLIKLREGKGWSQRQLAEKAGVSNGHVSHLELGRTRNPRPEELEKLAGALGVPVSYFLIQEGGQSKTQEEDLVLSALQALIIPEGSQLVEGKPDMYSFIQDLVKLAETLEDFPRLISEWASLGPGDMCTIADLIGLCYMRQKNNASGKVSRLVDTRRARVLGSPVKLVGELTNALSGEGEEFADISNGSVEGGEAV